VANWNTYASDTLIFYPGTVAIDTDVSTRASGKTFNVLEFQTETTIHAAATDQSTSEQVELKTITVGWPSDRPGPSTRRLKSITLNNGVTTYTATFAAPGYAMPTATLDAVSDGGVRMGVRTGTATATWRLEFWDSTTSSPSKADMRRLPLRLTLVYQPMARRGTDTSALVAMDPAQSATVEVRVPPTTGPDLSNVTHKADGTSYPATSATTTVGSASGGVLLTYDPIRRDRPAQGVGAALRRQVPDAGRLELHAPIDDLHLDRVQLHRDLLGGDPEARSPEHADLVPRARLRPDR
jgi:hypothetical protein